MPNDLTLPLQHLLAKAAKLLPRETGETARVAERRERPGPIVIVADCSGSMDESAGSRSKAELLAEAIEGVWSSLVERRLVAFNSMPQEVSTPSALPKPAGGTALDLALDCAATFAPARVVVVSDGKPDDPGAALSAADRLGCRIDVIYCGPDCDATAIAFMRRLARVGCGECVVEDVVRQATGARLISTVRRLSLPPT